MRYLSPVRLTMVFLAPLLGACAYAATPPTAGECLDLLNGKKVSISGVLTTQLFAGAPNYESIANGDAEERTLILELQSRLCANDGEFIEPPTTFDRVQLSSSDSTILGNLNAAVGRSVTVKGEAFGAHTGHHHAPLVMMVDEVSAQ